MTSKNTLDLLTNTIAVSEFNKKPSPFIDADIHWPQDLHIKVDGLPARLIPLIKEAILADMVANGVWVVSFATRMRYEFVYQSCRFSIETIKRWVNNDIKRSVYKITLNEWCV